MTTTTTIATFSPNETSTPPRSPTMKKKKKLSATPHAAAATTSTDGAPVAPKTTKKKSSKPRAATPIPGAAAAPPATPAVIATAAPPSTGVDPVPTNIAEAPPGWVTRVRVGRKGRRPLASQVPLATALADELRANAPALKAALGPRAPDPAPLAAALVLAHGWGVALDETKTFYTYARIQSAEAWDDALGLLAQLAPGYRYAAARDPMFAEQFSVLTKMYGEHQKVAAASAATRKANRKAKSEEASPPAAATPAVEASPTKPA